MSDIDIKPSRYIALLRRTFAELVTPGHALNTAEFMMIQKQINSCFAVAVEMEEEFEFLSNVVTPEVKPQPSAVVIPLRRKPRFHLICGSSDGGDAA